MTPEIADIDIKEFGEWAKTATLEDVKQYADVTQIMEKYSTTVSFLEQKWGHAFASTERVGTSFYKVMGWQNFGLNRPRLDVGDIIVIDTASGPQNMIVFKIKFYSNPRDMFKAYIVRYNG